MVGKYSIDRSALCSSEPPGQWIIVNWLSYNFRNDLTGPPMKKVTGFVDDFRRANILEKMPKTYFFEEDDRPDKMAKYIRKRNEPIADLMIVPDVKKPVGTDAEAYN